MASNQEDVPLKADASASPNPNSTRSRNQSPGRQATNGNVRQGSTGLITFGSATATPGARNQFSEPKAGRDVLGPILRRQRVVSMPLGAGGDFFVSNDHHRRLRQASVGAIFEDPGKAPVAPSSPTGRVRQDSGKTRQDFSALMKGVIRRKQVSLNLLGPNDFFVLPPAEEEPMKHVPSLPECDEENEETEPDQPKQVEIFRPLRFSPKLVLKSELDAQKAHANKNDSSMLSVIDEEFFDAMSEYGRMSGNLGEQLDALKRQLSTADADPSTLLQETERLVETNKELTTSARKIRSKFDRAQGSIKEEGDTEDDDSGMKFEAFNDDDIVRATYRDKVKAGILFLIMLGITIMVVTWSTHPDEESFIFRPIGHACVTNCPGNLQTRDFFDGHNHFNDGDVIELIMHLDANEDAAHKNAELQIQIVGAETGEIKATTTFGPPSEETRNTLDTRIVVDFDHAHEHHIINIESTSSDVEMSFTLKARVLAPFADSSILIAAIIMVVVYMFILLEFVHRTLVAIFGSMIALTFLFAMQHGETEGIKQIMLNMEWSTLGLLFGMMLIVGELSHTGVFEWCAVRLLMASKGSFVRLIVLLCTLTAVASAFLDNVTTMLLVAPVTIDMCNILGIDPRPYLIGEVLLSNVGGTATLIGDPPNIIIGASFDEIGFVDFIVDIMPCIFIFCIPVSLLLVVWVYRHYLVATEMRVLDTEKLIKAYPIYDEPRLMIAGTTTSFVILMFFLHPIHHKDTAWVALVGAFVTIAFTNPHDVHDALRNHVEWDTLLFFAGLFVLVEASAAMGLLQKIGDLLADYIEAQEEDQQLTVAVTLILWVSAITSAFLDNIPYTATMVPVVRILAVKLPDTLPIKTLAWALSFGACLGGCGTLLGASSNLVTAGIASNRGYEISFLNFFYPGMLCMITTVAISNVYMLVRFVWI